MAHHSAGGRRGAALDFFFVAGFELVLYIMYYIVSYYDADQNVTLRIFDEVAMNLPS